MSIRGIQGRVYHDKDNNRVVGIHTESEFAGQIMNDQQNFFKRLKYSNKLKINNKYLDKEDPEAFDTLLKFLVTIEKIFSTRKMRSRISKTNIYLPKSKSWKVLLELCLFSF